MRSRTEIVAGYRSGSRPGTGHTVVTSIRAGQHVAARTTAAGTVHLVGTAAGPLGGDEVEIVVRLGPGARLDLRSAGATIVQPGSRTAGSVLRLLLEVGDDAILDVGCEPTVVIHRAEHESHTEVRLAGSGQIRLLEQVVLGRTAEPPGTWTGRTRVSRDDAPLLAHRLRSSTLLRDHARVTATLLRTGCEAIPATSRRPPSPALSSALSSAQSLARSLAGLGKAAVPVTDHAETEAGADAVAMPLAGGGVLVTATGSHLLPVRAALDEVAARAVPHHEAGEREPAGR